MIVNAPASSRGAQPSSTVHAYPPSPAAAGSAPDTPIDKEAASEYSLPLPNLAYNESASESAYDLGDKADASAANLDLRRILRTPSPTPNEARVLATKTKVFGDWRSHLDYKRYTNRRGALTLALSVGIFVAFILFLVYQRHIADALNPFARWMHDTPGGWVIPIAIMFVLSFPPLLGHEVIVLLCGDVWGVWVGFGIVAAGTFVGEMGNYFVFKYCCMKRGKQFEERRLTWGLYAQVVRESGILIPTFMRLTFIPGHLLTAIFSTCGMSLWRFFVSAALSLPKQLAVVYIGVSQTNNGKTPMTSGIKAVVILATFAMSYVTMVFVNKKVDEVKEKVIYARRKARQARMLRGEDPLPTGDDDENDGERERQPEIALRPPTPRTTSANGPPIYMPAPQRAVASPSPLEEETHLSQPQPQPGRRGMRKMLGLAGRKKKRGSDASNGDVPVDVLSSGDVVELELGDRRELRARRHTEDGLDGLDGLEGGKGGM